MKILGVSSNVNNRQKTFTPSFCGYSRIKNAADGAARVFKDELSGLKNSEALTRDIFVVPQAGENIGAYLKRLVSNGFRVIGNHEKQGDLIHVCVEGSSRPLFSVDKGIHQGKNCMVMHPYQYGKLSGDGSELRLKRSNTYVMGNNGLEKYPGYVECEYGQNGRLLERKHIVGGQVKDEQIYKKGQTQDIAFDENGKPDFITTCLKNKDGSYVKTAEQMYNGKTGYKEELVFPSYSAMSTGRPSAQAETFYWENGQVQKVVKSIGRSYKQEITYYDKQGNKIPGNEDLGRGFFGNTGGSGLLSN